MYSVEITTLDIASFFHKRNIPLSKRMEIILDLWGNKHIFLENYMYDNLKIFSDEINNLLIDLSSNRIIAKETGEILKIQNDLGTDYIGYGLYKLNKNRTEEFLKECKLRIMYESKNDYIYMKMRTLIKSCGHQEMNKRFISELNAGLMEINLYMTDGYDEIGIPDRYTSRDIIDINLDEYIRIYSYILE